MFSYSWVMRFSNNKILDKGWVSSFRTRSTVLLLTEPFVIELIDLITQGNVFSNPRSLVAQPLNSTSGQIQIYYPVSEHVPSCVTFREISANTAKYNTYVCLSAKTETKLHNISLQKACIVQITRQLRGQLYRPE